jgi:hypothetical protein
MNGGIQADRIRREVLAGMCPQVSPVAQRNRELLDGHLSSVHVPMLFSALINLRISL